jgi:hypothetical protein
MAKSGIAKAQSMLAREYAKHLDWKTDEFKRDELQREVYLSSAALKAYPRGQNGLTPDDVKATSEWKSAHARYQQAFAALRAFNSR